VAEADGDGEVEALFDAARSGDVERLGALIAARPERLYARNEPHAWTLLHTAAHQGHLPAVEFLLERGLDVNAREAGDDTYPMHWAAAAGHLAVVRRLADAGGDVIGHGDDHALEVIGWATCWNGCDDDAHREVAAFLLGRGARHHVFSAIALNDAGELRRIVDGDPAALATPMSRNENHQLPLHFAVRMNRPEMVRLLLELGADASACDGDGMPVAAYAASPDVGREVAVTLLRGGGKDLVIALLAGDETAAERMAETNPSATGAGGAREGALHLLAKRGDLRAVRWLLARGADPSARWGHWEAEVTPLHLAALHGHADVVRALMEAGADPGVRDSRFDSDAAGWAEHAGHRGVAALLRGRGAPE